MSPPSTVSSVNAKSRPRRSGAWRARECDLPRSCPHTSIDKRIPEQARELGISEEAVIKTVMLKETVDGEFTTTADVAQAALFFAAFESNALTGQSLIVSHGWNMQ